MIQLMVRKERQFALVWDKSFPLPCLYLLKQRLDQAHVSIEAIYWPAGMADWPANISASSSQFLAVGGRSLFLEVA